MSFIHLTMKSFKNANTENKLITALPIQDILKTVCIVNTKTIGALSAKEKLLKDRRRVGVMQRKEVKQMRERLIELIDVARNDYYDFSDDMHEKGLAVGESSEEYIADYLLANGVVVPPVKVGEIVYLFYPVRKGIYEVAVEETGAEVKVPLFINEGDRITLDTRTGEYLGRAKG